jgi:flavodoxin
LKNKDIKAPRIAQADHPKFLVAFYSRCGNTMKLSHDISSLLGGQLENIKDLTQRQGFLKWITCAWDAMRKKETLIDTSHLEFGSYDMMVIGTPVWAGNMAPAIRTFINKIPLGRSRVALFAACGRDTGCI